MSSTNIQKNNFQVINNILIANDIDINFLHQHNLELLKKNVDFCDIYLQNSLNESFMLDEGIIKSASFANVSGVGVRAICGEKSFLNYANIISNSSINNLFSNLFISTNENKSNKMDSANNISTTNIIKNDIINNEVVLGKSLYTQENSIINYSNQYKIDLLNIINSLARQNPFVINVIASLSLEYDEICIARSDKVDCLHTDIRPLIHLSISVVIKKNDKIEKGGSGFGGRYALDKITQTDIAYHVNRAYNIALLKLDAKDGPKGQVPVVLGNGWSGVILHEAVGHGLEGDFNRKGSSAFSNKIGTLVASPNVTVIDDGTIENRRGSLNIDDEGNSTQKTVLIENGVLCNYLFDELNARLMHTNSTGNGRRESFACAPMPRMTNTYMLSGNYDPNEVIASVSDGIYADNFDGGQVDITSGQFVFNATNAWHIKNGKLNYPIKGCALVGNGPECLHHVSMIANDLALDMGVGTCGKNGQSVPVGVGQPTIRLDGGLVVGSAG